MQHKDGLLSKMVGRRLSRGDHSPHDAEVRRNTAKLVTTTSRKAEAMSAAYSCPDHSGEIRIISSWRRAQR